MTTRLPTPDPPDHLPSPTAGGSFVLTEIATPLGRVFVGAVADGVCLLEFGRPGHSAAVRRELERVIGAQEGPCSAAEAHLQHLESELRAYFSGERLTFTVPLVTPGTDFEREVWARLLAIPPGQTRSYGQLAADLGQPGAARAVGRANGRNRVAIVVPCHRVIATGGGLGGYGGGLDRKRWLLEHEARWAGSSLFSAAPPPGA